MSRVNIIHIDSTYTRDETLELEKLFCVQDITEQVKQKQRDIPKILNKFDEILSQNNEPDIDIGVHCSSLGVPLAQATKHTGV